MSPDEGPAPIRWLDRPRACFGLIIELPFPWSWPLPPIASRFWRALKIRAGSMEGQGPPVEICDMESAWWEASSIV